MLIRACAERTARAPLFLHYPPKHGEWKAHMHTAWYKIISNECIMLSEAVAVNVGQLVFALLDEVHNFLIL